MTAVGRFVALPRHCRELQRKRTDRCKVSATICTRAILQATNSRHTSTGIVHAPCSGGGGSWTLKLGVGMPSPGSTPREILSSWERTVLRLLLAAPALSARAFVGRLRMPRAWWGRTVLLLLLAPPALSASVHFGRMAPKIKLTYFNIEGVAEVKFQGPSPRARILQNCTSYALLALSGQGRCPACVVCCSRTQSTHTFCAHEPSDCSLKVQKKKDRHGYVQAH